MPRQGSRPYPAGVIGARPMAAIPIALSQSTLGEGSLQTGGHPKQAVGLPREYEADYTTP